MVRVESRIQWIRWVIKHYPKRSSRIIGYFFAYEAYRLGCRLSGHKIPGLFETESLPAGKYVLVPQRVPLGVRLLDKVFPFGAATHNQFLPHSNAVEEEMKKAGKTIQIVEISHELRVEYRN